jgi:hypothetical protein
MLSTILLYSGPIGYLLVWILYFIVTRLFSLSESIKNIFFVYAIVPWGCVCLSGSGALLAIL